MSTTPRYVTAYAVIRVDEGLPDSPSRVREWSVGDLQFLTAGPSHVIVKGLDRNGVEYTREGTGLLARAFQHEMDHLEGTMFVDRLRGIKRDLIVRKIRKLARSGKW